MRQPYSHPPRAARPLKRPVACRLGLAVAVAAAAVAAVPSAWPGDAHAQGDSPGGFALAGSVGDPFPVPLQGPSGLAEGAGGTIVAVDSLGGHVEVFYENGTHAMKIGEKGFIDIQSVYSPAVQRAIFADLVQRGYVGPDNEGSRLVSDRLGQLRSPHGVHVADGTIYVADSRNLRVQAFNESTGEPVRAYPVWSYVYGAAVSPDGGTLAAADAPGHRIVLINASTGLPAGQPIGSHCRFQCIRGDGGAEFWRPLSVAFSGDGSRMYVADSGNERVQVLNSTGGHVSSIPMPPHPDAADGHAGGPLRTLPSYVAPDGAAGTILVSAFAADTVYELAVSNGSVVRTFGGPGVLDGPQGVLLHSGGRVYVADSGGDRIAVFERNGTQAGEIGFPGHGPLEFGSLFDLAVEPDGRVVAADSGNDRVQFAARAPNGSYVHGGSFGMRGGGDGELRLPTGIDTGPGGDIFVADHDNNRVQRFDADGAYMSQFPVADADGVPAAPLGLAVGPGGSVHVTATGNHSVYVFAPGGELLRTVDAAAAHPRLDAGQTFPDGRLVQTAGSGVAFDTPINLDVGPDGRMYLVEEMGGRVRVLDADGSPLFDVGTPAAPGEFYGDSSFMRPTDVAVDRNGRIIVADSGHDRLQVFDHAGGFVSSTGSFGFCPHPECSGEGIQFDRPAGLAADANGTVYVADALNHRILVLDPLDSDAPSILSAGPPSADPGPAPAAGANVTVVFDEPVRVYQRPGSAPPSALVSVGGGAPAAAPYASGSGTDTLVFRHEPAGGIPAGAAPALAPGAKFSLNNGSITDLAGNRADLTVPMCSASVGVDRIEFGTVGPGGLSTPAGQTVSGEAGTLPLTRVQISAGPWTDAAGKTVLPPSATQAATGGGAWEPLGGEDGGVFARPAAVGGPVAVEFRLAVPADALPGGGTVDISQVVTYTATCDPE